VHLHDKTVNSFSRVLKPSTPGGFQFFKSIDIGGKRLAGGDGHNAPVFSLQSLPLLDLQTFTISSLILQNVPPKGSKDFMDDADLGVLFDNTWLWTQVYCPHAKSQTDQLLPDTCAFCGVW